MKRSIEKELKKWKEGGHPHPLLLRGARQVGKTFTIVKFGEENFDNSIIINFEKDPQLKQLFEGSLDPKPILEKICIEKKQEYKLGKTLIFFDEIQECPKAIVALRYFYEDMPGMHVIAAGSLLDFVLKSGEISIPVGRIQYIFLQALSFYEFLEANNNKKLLECIQNLSLDNKLDDFTHQMINNEFKKYMLIGGMPKVVEKYIQSQDLIQSLQEQKNINDTFRDDFGKYASKAEQRHLESVFRSVPQLVSKKFKYSKVDPDTKSRELKKAVELLEKAGIIHKVSRTSGEGLPFGAQMSLKHFKAIFLDIGLMQNILGMDSEIIKSEDFHSLAAGGLAEQVVGQELLANKSPHAQRELFYWERGKEKGEAELDYLHAYHSKVIGLEVKAGAKGKLKSLHSFMKEYDSPLGIQVSQGSLNFDKDVLSIPLYAVAEIDRLVESLNIY